MLKRNIRLIHGQDSQQVLEVQYAEITHFKDNFTLMATVSALLAGFVFMVFGLEAEQIGEYSKLHATSVAYMVAATGSLCANVLVVCLSTLASMLGPGLALRGPEGSVARALEGMRDEHDRVVRLFLFGVYSFFCTVVCLAWFEYEWPVAAPVSALVLGGIVALRRGSRQLARRFALGEEKAAGSGAAPKPPDAPPPAPPPAGAAPAALEKRGLLQKRGHVRKNWTTRFFEVADGALTYRDREGGRMLRSVMLSGETITCAPVDAADGGAYRGQPTRNPRRGSSRRHPQVAPRQGAERIVPRRPGPPRAHQRVRAAAPPTVVAPRPTPAPQLAAPRRPGPPRRPRPPRCARRRTLARSRRRR